MNLRVRDIATGSEVASRASIFQSKTGRPVQFEITEQTREAVKNWIASRQLGLGDYVFPSAKVYGSHLSTRQYARSLS